MLVDRACDDDDDVNVRSDSVDVRVVLVPSSSESVESDGVGGGGGGELESRLESRRLFLLRGDSWGVGARPPERPYVLDREPKVDW